MVELLGLHVAKVPEFHLFPVHKVDDGLNRGLVAGQDLALLVGDEHLDLVDLLARPEDVLGVIRGRVLRGSLEDVSEDGTRLGEVVGLVKVVGLEGACDALLDALNGGVAVDPHGLPQLVAVLEEPGVALGRVDEAHELLLFLFLLELFRVEDALQLVPVVLVGLLHLRLALALLRGHNRLHGRRLKGLWRLRPLVEAVVLVLAVAVVLLLLVSPCKTLDGRHPLLLLHLLLLLLCTAHVLWFLAERTVVLALVCGGGSGRAWGGFGVFDETLTGNGGSLEVTEAHGRGRL
mmetsp:Transcript_40703/g.68022  ORF Transcript_40703/g.68022 Transcript_40703/m.68022 type:complete len:291 (+) Transcript_40703:478-1350(+)